MLADPTESSLVEIDQPKIQLCEQTILETLEKLQEESTEREDFYLHWGLFAFQFRENDWGRELRDAPYFRPLFSIPDKSANQIEVPPREHINSETIAYWSHRVGVARYPVMRFRYAALAWEFSKSIPDVSSDVALAHWAIGPLTLR